MNGNVMVDIRTANERIIDYFKNKDLVTVEELLDSIDDLLYEKEELESKARDLEESIGEDYKPAYKDDYERYGVSRNDFGVVS